MKMKISDLLSMCFRSLFRRKVRTFLTVIGVVIGTCSIVIMISLGIGLDESQTKQFAEWMDLTTIQVYSSYNPQNKDDGNLPLNDKAIEYLQSLSHVTGVSPVMELYGAATVSCGKYTFSDSLVGMNLDQLENLGYVVTDGRIPQASDGEYAVVFGEQTAYQFMNSKTGEWFSSVDEQGNLLPPPVDPLTDDFTIQLNTQNSDGSNLYNFNGGASTTTTTDDKKKTNITKPQKLKVTGVLKGDPAKNYSTMYGIFIDINLAKELREQSNKLNGDNSKFTGYDQAYVKVDDFNNVADVEAKIKELGFDTYSAEQELDMAKEQSRMIQLVLGALGSISLLVAAIGITNTMIMSIYERTREIGVMKVLGCELKNIRMMFLCEAGAIGLMGGIIGLVFSYIISMIVNATIGQMMLGYSETPMNLSVIPVWLALLGIGFSVAVGLISGFLPANRAVKISALAAIKQD